jgi:tRNA(Ile)-lysidine synthase
MIFKRFKGYLAKKDLVKQGETIILAVSGGPDSLCLLHLFTRLASTDNLKLVVAHLNHGLRPEAAAEEAGLAALAARLNLPFKTKKVNIKSYKKRLKLSEEAAGRRARYRFLLRVARSFQADAIALGHHRDDQAETVLLNLLRGSGIDGLAGILPLRRLNGVKLIRPLLEFRRSEIESYCRDQGLDYYTDSSNLETEYTRNKIRLELIPHLEERYNPRIRDALAGLAELAAEDRYYFAHQVRKTAGQLVRQKGKLTFLDRLALNNLPQAISSRVLRQLLSHYQTGKELSRLHLNQLLELVREGNVGARLDLPGGLRAYRAKDSLILARKDDLKPEKIGEQELLIPGVTVLPGGQAISARLARRGDLAWPPQRNSAYLDYDTIPPGQIIIRARKPGDRFHPQGATGSKKLKSFLIDQKFDQIMRDSLPLVTVGGAVIWVAGLRIAHPYRVTNKTARVLCLDYLALQ